MNRTIQNPKRVSIIVDSEALGRVKKLLEISGTSFSFFVRAVMKDFIKLWKDVDPNSVKFFMEYHFAPREYEKITPRGKGGKNVQKNEK